MGFPFDGKAPWTSNHIGKALVPLNCTALLGICTSTAQELASGFVGPISLTHTRRVLVEPLNQDGGADEEQDSFFKPLPPHEVLVLLSVYAFSAATEPVALYAAVF
jgi:hypothetical protein